MRNATLSRCNPADQDVSSAGVGAFLDVLEAAPDIELHSLMLVRRGHVVAEGWWWPYTPERVHLLYSLSKSFTATAAGLAAAEGLLGFDDPVVSHFPDLADGATPRTRSMRVRHLAAMATGHRADTLERAVRADPEEPVRGFLALEPEAEPGSVFAYNNGATYTLAALVQRVTGQSLTGYLQPRLFDPLGIAAPYWHQHPHGREVGFSGLHLTTEAVARFGQLYLDDGVWQGARLLPEGWVAEASRLHTPNPEEPNPDWQRGYGYQLWRSRHGYRGDGAYGQFCLVLPDHDAVLVTTAQTQNMQGVLDAAWAHLVPALGTASPEQDEPLARRLADLRLPLDGPAPAPPADEAEPPEDIQLSEEAQIRATRLDEHPEGGWRLTLSDGQQDVVVHCGEGTWVQNDLKLRDGRQLAIAAAGTADDGSLTAQLAFVQTPHRLELRVATQRLTSSGRWLTVPLHGPSLAELAVGAA
ncbi:MAG: serine hydrolase domain-containing protein [Friedmanniella sp.]